MQDGIGPCCTRIALCSVMWAAAWTIGSTRIIRCAAVCTVEIRSIGEVASAADVLRRSFCTGALHQLPYRNELPNMSEHYIHYVDVMLSI
jgi:hypothetical protein